MGFHCQAAGLLPDSGGFQVLHTASFMLAKIVPKLQPEKGLPYSGKDHLRKSLVL
jgi:hypothetical protein